MAKVKSRPQAYPAMSFHLIRAIAFISQAIVSGILIWFCLRLRKDGFKLPWTFLIVLAASLLSLLTLIITTFFYLCAFLSPLFNLILNVSIIIIQFVGYVLLTWNMYGALGHSCSRSTWGNSDGVMVCQTYKAFYSFAVFALLAQIALIVLDVRSRRQQTRLGRYGNIEASNSKDVKLDKLDRSGLGGAGTGAGGVGHAHQPSHASSVDSVPYGITDYSDQPTRPVAYQPPTYAPHPQQQVRMGDYGNTGYGPQQAYGSGAYGYYNSR